MKYWNCEGKYQDQFDQLAKELMPPVGASGTIGGEALRSISRIYYDAHNNGFCNNTSGALNYLNELGIPELTMPLEILRPCVNTGDYTNFEYGDKVDIALDSMVDIVVKYLIDDPEIARMPTKDDMLDFGDGDVLSYDDEDYFDEEE